MTAPLHIVWFKRDLRLVDHRPLVRALDAVRSDGGVLLPLYVVEPELWLRPDRSRRQWAFMLECLDELDQAPNALGSRLITKIGALPAVLQQLSSIATIAALYSHEETGCDFTYRRDLTVAAWARSRCRGKRKVISF